MKSYEMKCLLLAIGFISIINSEVKGQATNGVPANNNYLGINYLGFTNTNGANPLRFLTNNAERMRINGNTTAATPAPSGTQITNGFVGINITDPWSRVHIGGQGLSAYGGYRPWMLEGLTLQNANDQMWLGLVQWGGAADQQNATMNWGDDGADHFVFSCTNSTYGGAYSPFSPASTTSLKGREVMRLTDLGFVGIGPNFNNTGNIPQSPLHINGENTVPTYLQVTNGFTGQTTNTDGFTFGVNSTGIGEVTQYESSNMKFKINSGWGMFAAVDIEPGLGRVGINRTTAANRLEITSTWVDPTPSGLRFTNLTASSATVSNPGNGVLGVNGSGDVIYVDGATPKANEGCSVSGNFVQLGAFPSPGAAAILSTDRYIPMNAQRIYMHGNNNSDGLTIGSNGLMSPAAKLQVRSNESGGSSPMAIYAESIKPSFSNIAVYGLGTNSSGTPGLVNYGVVGGASDATNCIGAKGFAGPTSASGAACIGVVGEASIAEPAVHIGVVGQGVNSINTNEGAEFYGLGRGSTTSFNYGAYSNGEGGNSAWGLSAVAGTATARSYGVQGAIDGGNNVLIYPTSQNRAIYGATTNYSYTSSSGGGAVDNYAGYFDGDVFINGIGMSTGFISFTSDAKFKTKLDSISNATNIIKRLKPKTYYMDTTNVYGLSFSGKKQYGFIAQEVEKILPEFISQVNKSPRLDSSGKVVYPGVSYKTLNYNGFFALLMKGAQEQQSKIDSLVIITTKQDSINKATQKRQDSIVNSQQTMQTQIDALEALIRDCCARQTSVDPNGVKKKSQYDGPDTDVNLNNKDIIVLEQNVPNPFAEQTIINFNIPVTVKKAQLIFYNSTGNIIQTADIITRGRGKVNVFASDLSSGIYNYTLVADGKVIDSKKMARE